MYDKEHYDRNCLKISEKRYGFRKRDPAQFMLRAAKRRASQKNLPFNIEYSDINIPDVCPILKEPLVVRTRYAPSLDRIIPDIGYVKGNVWVISKKANMMKQNATKEELNNFGLWAINQ